MADKSRKGYPEILADTKSAEDLRRKFIEGPLDASGQPALQTGLELASLLAVLPDAFRASQKRELERLQRQGKEDDPRIDALKTSMQQAQVLRTTAARGQARLQRALLAQTDRRSVFHGFVSDADFAPIPSLTVRLAGDSERWGKPLSATTEDDGYFCIPLGSTNEGKQEPFTGRPGTVSQRIQDFFAEPRRQSFESSATENANDAVRVEILKDGNVLWKDSVALKPDGGSVYREYLIADFSAD